MGHKQLRPDSAESRHRVRRRNIPSVTSPFLTFTHPRWKVPSARQEGISCSVVTATSWSTHSSRPRRLRRARAEWRRSPRSLPKSPDEPVCEPRRLLVRFVPVPGRENLDRRGRSRRSPASLRGGASWCDGQASCGRSDHREQTPVPDGTGMARTCRQATGFDRRINDPERARRNRSADRLDATNPRLREAPNRIRRGTGDAETVSQGALRNSEGEPSCSHNSRARA